MACQFNTWTCKHAIQLSNNYGTVGRKLYKNKKGLPKVYCTVWMCENVPRTRKCRRHRKNPPVDFPSYFKLQILIYEWIWIIFNVLCFRQMDSTKGRDRCCCCAHHSNIPHVSYQIPTFSRFVKPIPEKNVHLKDDRTTMYQARKEKKNKSIR